LGWGLSAVSSCESLEVAKASKRLKIWTDDAREREVSHDRPRLSIVDERCGKGAGGAVLPSPTATAVHGLQRGKDMLYSTRRIVDAIFYVLRNGVTWWALPLDFPPWQTVY
jgi:transposase